MWVHRRFTPGQVELIQRKEIDSGERPAGQSRPSLRMQGHRPGAPPLQLPEPPRSVQNSLER